MIFNKRVTWSENMKIVAWVVLVSHKEKLKTWLVMQCRKEWSTLRVVPKGKKPAPRVVYCEGDQGGQIAGYLEYRRLARRIWRVLGCEPPDEALGEGGCQPTQLLLP